MSVKIITSEALTTIENDYLRLELTQSDEGYKERIFVRHENRWCDALRSHNGVGDPSADFSPSVTSCSVLDSTETKGTIFLEGKNSHCSYRVTITLNDGDHFLRYHVAEIVESKISSRSLMSRYAFAAESVDFSFGSHLRPAHNQVIGQFAFKSPALIFQKDQLLVTLVADVDLITDNTMVQPLCLEPDVSGYDNQPPMLAYGFKNHEPHGLIYFQHRPDMIDMLEPQTREYGYILYVRGDAEPKFGYREIVRLLWQLFGEASFNKVDPQVIPFDTYGDHALNYALPNLWRDLSEDEQERGGMLMGIKFPNDIWFHFFFNHLHTAFGLYRMGQRRNRTELVSKAKAIRNLISSAPRFNGAIPAIFSYQIINGIRKEEWIPHAHWVGGSIPYQTQIPKPPDQPAYSTQDISWTAYWMLRWDEELESDEQLLEIAKEYGELLLQKQLPSGAVPVWLDKDTLEPLLFLRESPGSAISGVLFSKLYARTEDERYLAAARKVAAFQQKRCMPQGWTDYESFFDSAGKPVDLVDPYSGQRPQCTFPIFWTALLGKELHAITGEEQYREQALRAIDYLLLFQGVWSPPYLTVKGFGSIGIGNGHTGWNDARSGIFAPFIAEFYELDGNSEYLKRGVAAMRAPLALMYIPENERVSSVFDKGPLGYADECYAHRGRDARLGPSTFDFSIGYALMAYEEIYRTFGAAYLNLETGDKIGIDGCVVTGFSVKDTDLNIQVVDHVGKDRRLDIVVERRHKEKHAGTEKGRIDVFSQPNIQETVVNFE